MRWNKTMNLTYKEALLLSAAFATGVHLLTTDLDKADTPKEQKTETPKKIITKNAPPPKKSEGKKPQKLQQCIDEINKGQGIKLTFRKQSDCEQYPTAKKGLTRPYIESMLKGKSLLENFQTTIDREPMKDDPTHGRYVLYNEFTENFLTALDKDMSKIKTVKDLLFAAQAAYDTAIALDRRSGKTMIDTISVAPTLIVSRDQTQDSHLIIGEYNFGEITIKPGDTNILTRPTLGLILDGKGSTSGLNIGIKFSPTHNKDAAVTHWVVEGLGGSDQQIKLTDRLSSLENPLIDSGAIAIDSIYTAPNGDKIATRFQADTAGINWLLAREPLSYEQH